jgi:N-acyl-D-aspartate/D-glutamate deacylase
MSLDLIIRGGTIIDGTGTPSFTGDIGVKNGVIVEVGRVSGTSNVEVHAEGALVTPGTVDIHTHYDGQVSWDPEMKPSSNHGVTTAVMGNCGVGFAPVRPDDRETIIKLMEGVEDIPGTVLHEGITWEWESFGEYIDALEKLPRTIDIGLQVPHNAVRLYVMGERAVRREVATPADIAAMQALVLDGLDQGALGFTTANTVNHRDSDGNPTYARLVAKNELFAIGEAMGKAGKGVLQIFNDFWRENAQDFPTLVEWAKTSGRPLSFTLEEDPAWEKGSWQHMLSEVEAMNAQGIIIRPQVAPRSIGAILSLAGGLHPFLAKPSYLPIMGLSLAGRVAAMRNPELRAKLVSEVSLKLSSLKPSVSERADAYFADLDVMCKGIWVLGDTLDYEQDASQTVAALAARQNLNPIELLYDLLLEKEGHNILFSPAVNYTDGNLDAVHDMLVSPHAMIGLSDGGAHVGYICDGSFPSYLLSYWTRDRVKGPKLSIERAVQLQTTATAWHIGLHDRGAIRPGLRADLNIIDYDNLKIAPPRMVADLPAGGERLLQDVTGYIATFKDGVMINQNDRLTGLRPGKVIRGVQSPRGH